MSTNHAAHSLRARCTVAALLRAAAALDAARALGMALTVGALGVCVGGLLACRTPDYGGRAYAPGEFVEVFLEASKVPEPYVATGEDASAAPGSPLSQAFLAQVVREAQRRSADAVVLANLELGLQPGASEDGATPDGSVAVGAPGRRAPYFATIDGRLHRYHAPSGGYVEVPLATGVSAEPVRARFVRYSRRGESGDRGDSP